MVRPRLPGSYKHLRNLTAEPKHDYTAKPQRDAQCGKLISQELNWHGQLDEQCNYCMPNLEYPKLQLRLLHPHKRLLQLGLALHTPNNHSRRIHKQKFFQHSLRHRLYTRIRGLHEFPRLHV